MQDIHSFQRFQLLKSRKPEPCYRILWFLGILMLQHVQTSYKDSKGKFLPYKLNTVKLTRFLLLKVEGPSCSKMRILCMCSAQVLFSFLYLHFLKWYKQLKIQYSNSNLSIEQSLNFIQSCLILNSSPGMSTNALVQHWSVREILQP